MVFDNWTAKIKAFTLFIVLMVIASGCLQISHQVEMVSEGGFEVTTVVAANKDLEVDWIEDLVDFAETFEYRYEIQRGDSEDKVVIAKRFSSWREWSEILKLSAFGIERIETDPFSESIRVVLKDDMRRYSNFLDGIFARIHKVELEVIDADGRTITQESYVPNLLGRGISGPFVPPQVAYALYAVLGGMGLLLIGSVVYLVQRRRKR